jgi:hypothetical protein
VSGWKPEDEVTTTFGSIQLGMAQAYEIGTQDGLKTALEALEALETTDSNSFTLRLAKNSVKLALKEVPKITEISLPSPIDSTHN